MRPKRVVMVFVSYCVLGICLLFVLIPFAWTIACSLKVETDILETSVRWIPKTPTLEHYKWVIGMKTPRITGTEKTLGLLVAYRNTAIATLGAVALTVITSTLGGYALSRFEFRGRSTIGIMILSTALFPLVLMLLPWYLILLKLRLLDTILGLILTLGALLTPFSVWMMKGFVASIPPELEECAMIDGCTKVGAFARVTIPLIASGVLAVVMYTVVMTWNAYLLPLVVTGSTDTKPVAIAIMELFGFYGRTYWGGLMAATVVTCLPVVVLFIFLQRHFVSGMTAGAVKG